jgi:hypothetical protein
MLNRLAVLMCAALLWTATPAKADEWNKKTTVTFSRAVELPGIVLPAGTYVFKLMNSYTNRNIVMVYNEAEDHLYTMILAINNYRLNPTADPVLRFAERGRNRPEALRAWFYAGDGWGQEFVYPKAQAARIAETEQAPVLAADLTPAEKPEELFEAPVEVLAAHPNEAFFDDTMPELTPPLPPERPVEAVEAANTAVIAELPKTGTNWIPMILFMGVFGLVLGAVMKYTSRPH